MNVGSASQAAMTVYIAALDPVTGEITSYGSPLQTFQGQYGDEWNVQRMTISAQSRYRIVFYAKTGGYPSDVIAIDDVSVQDRECDTAYFTVNDYTEKANTYGVNEAIISDTMYTGTPGYAFQAVIYPNGSQSAVDAGYTDYLGFSFQLVGGKYDDELEWPFDKQYIRLLITDQDPNPQTRMNWYYNFLTSKDSSLNASWEKPTGLGVANTPVGYRTFMPKWRMNTRSYLRHDTAYYSIQVTDMRPYEGSTEISAKMSNPVLRKRDSILAIPEQNVLSVESTPDGDDELIDYRPDDNEQDMISVKSASIIVTVTSGIVFLIMAFAICAVAKANRNRLQMEYTIMNNIRYIGPEPGETMKYKCMKGKV
uniref:meprin A subunit alpha-like isoform X1 n=1 Tax=Styela clava TaxID=7725 RepID=UPI00193A3B6D|nr:meprin A subunit alpha-like isoform X1 [Styela clava]